MFTGWLGGYHPPVMCFAESLLTATFTVWSVDGCYEIPGGGRATFVHRFMT